MKNTTVKGSYLLDYKTKHHNNGHKPLKMLRNSADKLGNIITTDPIYEEFFNRFNNDYLLHRWKLQP